MIDIPFHILIPLAILGVIIFLWVVLLPNWLLLVLGIPFARLETTSLISIGDIDIRACDFLILIITFKICCFIAISKRKFDRSLNKPILLFLIIQLCATILSFFRFGTEIFNSELVSFLRFMGLFFIFFLTVRAIGTPRQIEWVDKFIDFFGYIAAISVYLGLVLFMLGIEFGEVSTEDGIRTFGVYGDQIGFILPLFLYKELLKRRIVRCSFFGIAIVLTGTRGALVTSGIGMAFLYLFSLQGREFLRYRYKILISSCIVTSIIATAFVFDLGGMRTRFEDASLFAKGISTRGITVTIAARVFLDNPLIGVGFGGFRLLASDYRDDAIFAETLYYYPNPALVATTANQYLQVATDAGIVGLIAFLWLIKRSLEVLKKAQSRVQIKLRYSFEATYIWLWSLLVGAQSVSWLLPDMTLSYILLIIMGMAIAAITIEDAVAPEGQLDAAHF